MRTLLILVFIPMAAALAQTSYSVQGANQLAAAKNWNGWLDYAKAWTAAQPTNAVAWYQLGNAYAIGLHDNPPAAEAFEHAVALNAQWAEAWNALGCTYALSEQFAKAIPAFQHAVDADPHKAVYWDHLQAAHLRSGNGARAKEILDRAVESAGAYAKAADWYLLANAYAALNFYPRAIELYNRAVAMNTRFAEAYNNRGSAEQGDGRWRDALVDYQRAAGLKDSLAAGNAANLKTALDELEHQKGVFSKAGATAMGKVPQYPKGHTGAAHLEASFAMNPASH